MMRDVWGLTVVEFIAIKRNLENISDTWPDLWAMLYLSQAKPGQLLGAKFDDVSHDILVLSATKGLRERCIALKPGVKRILHSRREKYPEDVFLFQSHSHRTKTTPRPVTLVAFNAALKRASIGVTAKTVSSKSAYYLTPLR
ncbi:hypothetical protein [Enterobacter ludwigii]|uniref:hypothetical protein n=1 Tax=Enterobacter ludwigii TaxID=299767 RepID=UPI002E2C7585|nr:hypothetical protein [Enterobacter ludwigii]MED5696864.1 hypothetical protein [Enterobacter ludwigii]